MIRPRRSYGPFFPPERAPRRKPRERRRLRWKAPSESVPGGGRPAEFEITPRIALEISPGEIRRGAPLGFKQGAEVGTGPLHDVEETAFPDGTAPPRRVTPALSARFERLPKGRFSFSMMKEKTSLLTAAETVERLGATGDVERGRLRRGRGRGRESCSPPSSDGRNRR